MKKIASASAHINVDYTVVNTGGNHTFFADEHIDFGGQDKGPKPTEMFLAALASCILITLRMYAKRREWEVGEIHIDLTMNATEDGTEIVKNIEFSGVLNDEQKKRLLDISNRCPVAKIISNPIEFKFA